MAVPRRRTLLLGTAAGAVALGAVLALTQPWLLLLDEQVSEALPVAAAPTTDPPGSALPPEPGTPADTSAAPPADQPTDQPTDEPTDEPADQPTDQPAGEVPDVVVTPAGPVELSRGELVSHEHATTGTVRLLDLGDGTRVLRIEGLDTSNGPDLRVWLSDAEVLEGRDGWFLFDDGAHVDLGPLEGNQGDANYEVPADVDLAALTSVSIWCARFRVSFGAAQLT